MTTPQQLAERLGLQDFDTFALEARWRLADLRQKHGGMSLHEVTHRQQGHSTRGILGALCHVADTGEDVLIVANSRDMAGIFRERADGWAVELGLDPRKIKATARTASGRRGWHDRQVFVDHVVHEHPDAC